MDHRSILVYLLMALLVMAPLLGSGYYLALDMQFGPNSFADWQFQDLYGFEPSSYGAYLPVKLVMAALSSLMGVEAVEKLLLFTILFLCGISMHSSLPEEHGPARYFAGLLYMLNPFVFIRFLAGHWSLLLSYSLWPFALSSFHRFLEDPGDRKALAKAAIMTTLAAVSSHGVIILLISYALLLLSHILRRGIDISSAKRVAMLAALVLAMNLYWILPTALLFHDVYDPAPAEAYFKDFGPESSDMPLGLAMATMHGFWRGGFQYTKDVFPLWPLVFLLIALLAVKGFVTLLRERALHALFFLALFITALALALGPTGPFGGLFGLFGDALPLHMLFRDSQKFSGLICMVYAMLGSYGAHSLLENHKRFPVLLLSGLIVLPVLYNFGFFGFLGQIGPTSYPSDWAEADSFMAADATEGRLLVLPAYLYNWYPWVNSGQKTLGTPASQFFSRQVISEKTILTPNVYGDVKDPYGDYLHLLFDNRQHMNDTSELLAPLGVRYVIILKDSEEVDNYRWLFDRRGGVENISLVYEGDSLYLFRNDFMQGIMMSSDDPGSGDPESMLASVGKGLNSPSVAYEKITPASYEITGSELEYVVFPNPSPASMRFDSEMLSGWNGIASAFRFASPGTLQNPIFPIVLALFLLSWMAVIALLLGVGPKAALLLFVPAAALFFMISGGMLQPSGIGALLVLSALAALAPSRADFTNFLNIE